MCDSRLDIGGRSDRLTIDLQDHIPRLRSGLCRGSPWVYGRNNDSRRLRGQAQLSSEFWRQRFYGDAHCPAASLRTRRG